MPERRWNESVLHIQIVLAAWRYFGTCASLLTRTRAHHLLFYPPPGFQKPFELLKIFFNIIKIGVIGRTLNRKLGDVVGNSHRRLTICRLDRGVETDLNLRGHIVERYRTLCPNV